MLNKLLWYYETSKNTISDSNKFFIFNYWKTLTLLLKTKLKFFKAYYLKTDEKIKKIN